MARSGVMTLVVVSLAGCLALADEPTLWPCSTDGDCKAREQCKPAENSSQLRCQPRPECTSNGDCPGGSHCSNNRCVKNGCEPGEDPACGRYQCLSTFACRTTCVDHDDCSSDSRCYQGRCEAIQCEPGDDAACGDFRCDASAFVCPTSCQTSHQCRGDLLCRQGRCEPAECKESEPGSCGGFACEKGFCRTSCTSDSHCDPGVACIKGVCALNCSTGGDCPINCDPAKQTGCTTKPKTKCTVIAPGEHYLTECTEPEGQIGVDQSCSSPTIGFDKCAPGLLCTGYGVSGYEPPLAAGKQCKRFCRANQDCGAQAFCAAYSDDGFGVCIEACTPFAACTGAAAGSFCSRRYLTNQGSELRLGCRSLGNAVQGDGCTYEQDCKAGLACKASPSAPAGSTGVCTPLCDAQHPCKAPLACVDTKGPCADGRICLCQ